MDLDSQLKTSLERDREQLPPGLAVDELMHAGRGAVRRRRLAAMSLTAVVVAGSAGLWQVATDNHGGAPDRADSNTARADVAKDPSSLDPNQVDAPDPLWPAKLTVDGKLKLAPGMRVIDRIDDPWPNADASVALELRSDTEHLFFITETDERAGSSSSWTNAGEYYRHLKPWVDDLTRYEGGPDSSDGFVIRNGDLVATQPGTRVIEQVKRPQLGADSMRYAVGAEISIDGKRWFVFTEEYEGESPKRIGEIMTWTRVEPAVLAPDERTLDGAIRHITALNNAETQAEKGSEAGNGGSGTGSDSGSVPQGGDR